MAILSSGYASDERERRFAEQEEGRHPYGSTVLVAMKQYTLLSDWTPSTDVTVPSGELVNLLGF